MDTLYLVGLGALIILIFVGSFAFNRKMKNKVKQSFEEKHDEMTKIYTKWNLISLSMDARITNVNGDIAYAFKELNKEGVNVPIGDVNLTIYARDTANLGAVREVTEIGPISYNVKIESGKQYTLQVNKEGNVVFEQYNK